MQGRTNFREKFLAQKSELAMIGAPPVSISPPPVGLGLNGGVETLE